MRTAPKLLESAIASAGVKPGRMVLSRTSRRPICKGAPVRRRSFARKPPRAIAKAATTGFIVDPGSNKSVTAALRRAAPSPCLRLLGLKEGAPAIAKISPLWASNKIAPPDLAPCAATARSKNRYARYCRRKSIVKSTARPARGARCENTSISRPSRIANATRRPSLAASFLFHARSTPSTPALRRSVNPVTCAAKYPAG